MEKLLIYIAGKKGSGKSTLINLFSLSGYFTTELRYNLEKALLSGEINPKTIPVPFYWNNEMLEFSFKKIKDEQLVILTGLYNTKDLQHFYRLGFQVVIISVTTKDQNRFQRILEREGAKGNYLTIQDILYKDSKRDGKAQGFEFNNINDLIKLSRYNIINEGNFQDLESEFSKLLLSLRADFPNHFK